MFTSEWLPCCALVQVLALASSVSASPVFSPITFDTGISPVAEDYNSKYPLTPPIINPDGSTELRFAIISDQDVQSKHATGASTWLSYLKLGTFKLSPDRNRASISWDTNSTHVNSGTSEENLIPENVGAGLPIISQFAFGNRGMELSDIVVFDGKLFACEDRTGIIFELIDNQAVPWVILADGNGRKRKGFKCEWSVVKDNHLYVGSHSADIKVPHPDGPSVKASQRWLKKVSKGGHVEHLDWNLKFNALENHLGISPPGYVMHESVLWSEKNQKWYFLPRQISHENYTAERHPYANANLMITADGGFSHFGNFTIGQANPLYGFSAARFVPGSNDSIIVALRIMEIGDNFSTHLLAFTINGDIILEEEEVLDGLKYEGIEFI